MAIPSTESVSTVAPPLNWATWDLSPSVRARVFSVIDALVPVPLPIAKPLSLALVDPKARRGADSPPEGRNGAGLAPGPVWALPAHTRGLWCETFRLGLLSRSGVLAETLQLNRSRFCSTGCFSIGLEGARGDEGTDQGVRKRRRGELTVPGHPEGTFVPGADPGQLGESFACGASGTES